MQYTANKPCNSVLIIQPSGLRYRFQEDHVFKEIRYAQVTRVKLKKDFFRLYFIYLLTPILLIGQFFVIQDEGLNFINELNFIFGALLLGFIFSISKPTRLPFLRVILWLKFT